MEITFKKRSWKDPATWVIVLEAWRTSKWLKLMCLFVTLCMSVCVEPFLGWFLEEGPRAIILDQFLSIGSTKGCIEHHWVLQVELDVYPSDL